MTTIGVRELRQHASRYLALVKAGETVEVTERGKVIARIAPASDRPLSPYERLVAEGAVHMPTRDFHELPPPVALPPGAKPLSEILAEMRSDER